LLENMRPLDWATSIILPSERRTKTE
jgi:hypothetical protein